jgi:hypothetical protein
MAREACLFCGRAGAVQLRVGSRWAHLNCALQHKGELAALVADPEPEPKAEEMSEVEF